MQAHNALARGEILGGLQYLRLLSETAIRVRWIAGDDDKADANGRPLADAGTVARRAQSMKKRDLELLAAAYKAIHAIDPGESDLSVEIDALAGSIQGPAAPRDVRALARTHSGKAAYANHRLCSAQIHPGASLGRGNLMPAQRVNEMIDEAAYLCAAWADASLRSRVEVQVSG